MSDAPQQESFDPFEEIDKQLDKDFPQTIILDDDNDRFVGRFVRVDSGPSAYGPTPIVVLQNRAGDKEFGLWLFHSTLKNQFAQQKPKVGEVVGVRYKGKRQGASGNMYHDYRVEVFRDANATDFDWAVIEDKEASEDLAAAPEDWSMSEPAPAPSRGSSTGSW